MKLYNSLTRKVDEFKPMRPPQVGMYTCGQTVYDYTHIGHGRKYVNDDLLRRTLTFLGFKVKHVQNVTDVGHLVSDGDSGEDKLEKGAKKFGKTVWEVAEFFTEHFYQSMDQLNVLRPDIIAKATEHIADQINLVQVLLNKGYAYDTDEAVYFDVAKFKDYGQLFAGQSLEEKKVAVRETVKTGEYKRNPADFALWFKTIGRFADHQMHWSSPWGEGFPGWHIECSAMSMKYLGDQFDIHTGGEDHLSVHHPNEIAQSEAASGKKPFVRYWLHHAFLKIGGQKMSKSLGNLFTVEDVVKKGVDPLALRYLYLTSHYRKALNFTWEALQSAVEAYGKLKALTISWQGEKGRTQLSEEKLNKLQGLSLKFRAAIEDDLNLPQALAVVWEMAKSNIPETDKYEMIADWDKVLGLDLTAPPKKVTVPKEIQTLINQREALRKQDQWEEADKLRVKIEAAGFKIKDKHV
jgi:cysteinyl-tRNA synthetase